ncbi:hypothetical protein H5410_014359, partial [Solanum commersonii]
MSRPRVLEASRHKDLAPSVCEGVDTLLMYLYRALNRVDDMERLASSDNSCVVVCLYNLSLSCLIYDLLVVLFLFFFLVVRGVKCSSCIGLLMYVISSTFINVGLW